MIVLSLHQQVCFSICSSLIARGSDLPFFTQVAWLQLRMSRILFAEKHIWTPLRMSRTLFVGGYLPFSSPEPPFLLITWSEKRHFKTSSTGDENGYLQVTWWILCQWKGKKIHWMIKILSWKCAWSVFASRLVYSNGSYLRGFFKDVPKKW